MGMLVVQVLGLLAGLTLWSAFGENQNKHWKWVTRWTQWWGRGNCFCLNIHYRIEGNPKLPPGALVVSNHVGSPDIFILASCFKTFFVSKSDVRSWPLLGKMADVGATVFIDRSQRRQVAGMVEGVGERLRNGFHVALFPEGGATRGDSVYPFMSSVFEAAVQEARPVVPVAIRYHDGHTPSMACWADIGFIQHMVRLLTFPKLEATVHILPPEEPDTDRHELARRCHDAVFEKYLEGYSAEKRAEAESLFKVGLEKHW